MRNTLWKSFLKCESMRLGLRLWFLRQRQYNIPTVFWSHIKGESRIDVHRLSKLYEYVVLKTFCQHSKLCSTFFKIENWKCIKPINESVITDIEQNLAHLGLNEILSLYAILFKKFSLCTVSLIFNTFP